MTKEKKDSSCGASNIRSGHTHSALYNRLESFCRNISLDLGKQARGKTMSKSISDEKTYEKLEHQMKNPHLYTTMSQLVNPDGTITTFDEVTYTLQQTLKQLEANHSTVFGGEHPIYCMRPLIGQPEHPICQAIELVEKDKDKVRLSFVENYKKFQERRATR